MTRVVRVSVLSMCSGSYPQEAFLMLLRKPCARRENTKRAIAAFMTSLVFQRRRYSTFFIFRVHCGRCNSFEGPPKVEGFFFCGMVFFSYGIRHRHSHKRTH